MNKTDMINHIATEAVLTITQARNALEAFESGVINTLAKGAEVKLVGFGTFSVKKRAARTGRNPKTGEPIDIAASKTAAFKSGKSLNEAIWLNE